MSTTANLARTRYQTYHPIELELFASVWLRQQLQERSQAAAHPSTSHNHHRRRRIDSNSNFSPNPQTCRDSYALFHSFSDNSTATTNHLLDPAATPVVQIPNLPKDLERLISLTCEERFAQLAGQIAEPTLSLDDLNPEDRAVFEDEESSGCLDPSEKETATCVKGSCRGHNQTGHGDQVNQVEGFIQPSKRSVKKQLRISQKKEARRLARERDCSEAFVTQTSVLPAEEKPFLSDTHLAGSDMTSEANNGAASDSNTTSSVPAQHKPLVVGRTKPQSNSANNMADSNDPTKTAEAKAALNKEIEANLQTNTKSAGPADNGAEQSSKKKEKAPKAAKPSKAAPPAAPLSPALIDLRVGHILRAIAHPNADSLYVSTIAMGDPEGTEHTQVDEETGQVVRTVCSGLNGLVPLEEMQNRKIIVVANLKPVNMRSIKSAAMVLAASPKAEEGADPHAHDRVVELVNPPEGSEAGDKVYFEGWPYGEGKGPEKTLNPKKKQWEAIQPGFYTSEDFVVGFDSSKSEMGGQEKGDLVVEGKGKCTVKSLKGAVVR